MLNRLARALLSLTVLVAVSGCYRVHVVNSKITPTEVAHAQLVHTFIGGILSLNHVDAGAMCGDAPVASVYSRMGILGLVATSLTAGIWTPMSVTVVCGAPAAGGMTELPSSPELSQVPVASDVVADVQ